MQHGMGFASAGVAFFAGFGVVWTVFCVSGVSLLCLGCPVLQLVLRIMKRQHLLSAYYSLRACLLPAYLVRETLGQPLFWAGHSRKAAWQRSLGNVLCTAPVCSSAARGLKSRGFTDCSVFASVYRSL